MPPVVLVETERLIEAARALEDHRHRLACAGVRGTLVIVCRLATTEMLVVERVIDLGAALS